MKPALNDLYVPTMNKTTGSGMAGIIFSQALAKCQATVLPMSILQCLKCISRPHIRLDIIIACTKANN